MAQTLLRGLTIAGAALAASILVASSAQALPPLPTLPKGWFVTAEALYGWRAVGSDGDTVVLGFTTQAPFYQGGGINVGGRFGADLRLGYGNKDWAVEGRFFGGFHWKKGDDLGAQADAIKLGSSVYGPGSNLGVVINSRLHTLELNVRKPLQQQGFAVFGGVRWLSFDDRFSADVTNAGSFHQDYDARTTAFGLQVGGEGRFSVLKDNVGFELLYAAADVRAGAFFERTTQTFAYNFGPPGGSNGSITSPFVEAGLTLGRRIGPYSLEGGYRVFWVNSIPTGEGYAADATATSNVNNPPVGHSLLVHALTIGVKGKF